MYLSNQSLLGDDWLSLILKFQENYRLIILLSSEMAKRSSSIITAFILLDLNIFFS